MFDSYANWQAALKLQMALEADWVIERQAANSQPGETYGGAGYVRYQFHAEVRLRRARRIPARSQRPLQRRVANPERSDVDGGL